MQVKGCDFPGFTAKNAGCPVVFNEQKQKQKKQKRTTETTETSISY